MARSKWVPSDPYVPAPDRDELIASCVEMIKAMVGAPNVMLKHRRYWVSRVMWGLTEFEGKYNLPWASAEALKCHQTAQVTHEHVFPRGWLLDRILAEPDRLDVIARASIACIVTKAEAARLDREPPQLGWGRYRNAEVLVHNMNTFRLVSVDELMKEMPPP